VAVRLQTQAFDAGQELSGFSAGLRRAGAVVSFSGICRDTAANGEQLVAMTLEHYPGMAEAELSRIETEARSRWPLEDMLIVHRFGRLVPGDPIVLVLAASAHRAAAFEAAEFAMDFLKTQAPFWKLEETRAGADWVASRSADDDAVDRWRA
jgi:molybdopterin synthase catalytic subunit